MFFAGLYLIPPSHTISKLASIKQHANSLLLSKIANTGKITVAPGQIKVKNKHDLIQHTAQAKVAT